MAFRKLTTKHIATIFWLIVTIVPIIGIIVSLLDPISFFATQQDYREFITHYGKWAPLFFIGLQVLQVIITPMSHYSVGYMGGFLFGPFWGSIYNYVGRIIGHVITFAISRYIGTHIVQRFVPKETMEKYDKIVDHPTILFLIYFLPLFPDDEISYLVGLSKMRFRLFLIANLFGHLGGSISLAYLGSGINTHGPLFWIILLSTLAGFPVIWYLTKKNLAKKEALLEENE